MCNGLHQLGQPVAPSIIFPVFKSEDEPGTLQLKNYNIAFVFSLPEYQGLRDQPNFAGQINNFTATIGEDIVLKCRVKNVTSHRVNKYMYFIMEYCLLILRLISQVDWMLLDYRSFLSTLELLQGRGSILTMGNFKMTRNARIDIDHEEDTSSGTR